MKNSYRDDNYRWTVEHAQSKSLCVWVCARTPGHCGGSLAKLGEGSTQRVSVCDGVCLAPKIMCMKMTNQILMLFSE